MAYGHAERNLALIRQLEAETEDLLGTLGELDPEQSACLHDRHRPAQIALSPRPWHRYLLILNAPTAVLVLKCAGSENRGDGGRSGKECLCRWVLLLGALDAGLVVWPMILSRSRLASPSSLTGLIARANVTRVTIAFIAGGPSGALTRGRRIGPSHQWKGSFK
jgi:hypothetical protein